VQSDDLAEPWERFVVNLSQPVGATLPSTSASGRIQDDDTAPRSPARLERL
jgi:hypothetical protein